MGVDVHLWHVSAGHRSEVGYWRCFLPRVLRQSTGIVADDQLKLAHGGTFFRSPQGLSAASTSDNVISGAIGEFVHEENTSQSQPAGHRHYGTLGSMTVPQTSQRIRTPIVLSSLRFLRPTTASQTGWCPRAREDTSVGVSFKIESASLASACNPNPLSRSSPKCVADCLRNCT